MAFFNINHLGLRTALCPQTPATVRPLPSCSPINTFQKVLFPESLIIDRDTRSEHPFHIPLHAVVSDNNSVCV